MQQANKHSTKIVTDYPGFSKDSRTGAILNEDARALAAYRKRKDAARTTAQQIRSLQLYVDKIDNKLTEMQRNLDAFINGSHNNHMAN